MQYFNQIIISIFIVLTFMSQTLFAEVGFNGGRNKAKFLGTELIIYGLGSLDSGANVAFPYKKIYNNTVLQLINQQESEDEDEQPVAMNFFGTNKYLNPVQYAGLRSFIYGKNWICGIKFVGYDVGPMNIRNLKVYDAFGDSRIVSVFSLCIAAKDRGFLFDPSFVLDRDGFREATEPVVKKKHHKKKRLKKRPVRKPAPVVEYEPGLEIEPDNGG